MASLTVGNPCSSSWYLCGTVCVCVCVCVCVRVCVCVLVQSVYMHEFYRVSSNFRSTPTSQMAVWRTNSCFYCREWPPGDLQ